MRYATNDPHTEGPIDQRWTSEVDEYDDCFVYRLDIDARNVPTERIYWVSNPDDARHLANELNELDRLRRIEALALAWSAAIDGPNGVYDAETALRAALKAGNQ